jgi:hypothetical protein
LYSCIFFLSYAILIDLHIEHIDTYILLNFPPQILMNARTMFANMGAPALIPPGLTDVCVLRAGLESTVKEVSDAATF